METIDHSRAQEYLRMRKIDLTEDELQALQAHLATCDECRLYATSLEDLQVQLRTAFHARWDAAQPINSRSAGVLTRWGRETMRTRALRYAGTVIGVLAIIGLVLSLDFIIRNLRPQPAAQPPAATATYVPLVDIPSPTGMVSPAITSIASATPFPEGTIVLNMGYAIIPPDPEYYPYANQFAQNLSAASGLNVVPVPGPTTNMEILEALRDGKIQMAELDALTFVYGWSQGWVVPGPVRTWEYQPSGSIMFVARTDSGLVKGEPPQVLQQLAGKRPCWPDPEGAYQNEPPAIEYYLPAGLLAQAGVNLGQPVFVTRNSLGHDEAEAVYQGECDFAVVPAEAEESFLNHMHDYLMSRGVTFTQWKEQMQVLYTTPPLDPYYIYVFSSQLDSAKREALTGALLKASIKMASSGEYTWQPFDEANEAFYTQFQSLVADSGVDLSQILSKVWDLWLMERIAAAQAPAPTPAPTNPPSTRTLTVCMGAEPASLDFYRDHMYAQSVVLEAIYDGPIDNNGFSYQPVILEKLPSLADGDASIQPAAVQENDTIVNDAGQVVQLQPGTVVRPYGCNLSTCAITWQGGPLEMAQMSATFTLLQGIRWSDGEPLTADDSVFGFEFANGCTQEYLNAPSEPCGTLGASGRTTYASTASYKALDQYTTQWVGLPGYLDQAYMTNFAHPLPRHLMKTNTPEQFLQILAYKPIGWGPYKIDKWNPGAYIQMSKNPYYFRADEGLPHFDQLTFRFYGADEATTLAALQNGTCDLVDMEQGIKNLSLAGLLEASQQGVVKPLISTTTSWENLDFNIRPPQSIINSGAFAGWDLDGDGQGPFGDVRLRQAFALCMDRQQLVDSIFLGQSVVPDTYLSPSHPLYDSQAAHWAYDPAAASALLDEIGWLDADHDPSTPRTASGVTGVPDGTPLSLNLETTNAVLRQQVYDILSKSLAACGIQVNFQPYEAAEFFKAGADGRLYGRLYDLAEFSWMYITYPPCDLFMSSQVPSEENNWSGSNNPGFNDPAYDAACTTQLQSLPGGADYDQAVMESQRIFAEQLPVIPLFMREIHAAARPDMCGYSLDPTSNSDFSNIEAFDYGAGCK
jgi:peptide/nickel transport system substrate-binding protein